MNSILTKALMKYHNEFFTLSDDEKDAWKVQEHDDIDKKVKDYVSKALSFDDDDVDPEKQYDYNVIMLEYDGIGPNLFMLNDWNWNQETVSYKTLYDYNVYYHEWQETAMSEDENFDDFEPTELYNRFASWARAKIDGQFFYLNLDSIQIWINWKLDDVSYDWFDKEIPHDYVPGPNDGKKVEGGSLWDMRIDVKGLEGWYEQMRDFSYKWINDKYHNIEELGDVVFVIDKTEKFYDPSLDYVFGSMDVLKQLSFKTFIADVEKVKSEDNSILLDYTDKICQEFTDALDAEFEKVKLTPPNVVKLKKRSKVVMSDRAIDDLNREFDDE